MKFRTEVKTDANKNPLMPGSRILLMGSCFSEHMAGRLRDSGFAVMSNPFGNVYNPLTLQYLIKRIREKRAVKPEEVFEYDGLWHSFDFHSRYSGADRERVIHKMNTQIEDASSFLRQADILFFTFGSASAFFRKDSRIPVNNCHKLPSTHFDHRLLSIQELKEAWKSELEDLIAMRPGLRMVFTVSPVRYLKDGFFANSVSKSRLIELIYRLREKFDQIEYFPAYEILMDDLRDYRFYDRSLTHPSDMGIEYVWEKWLDQFTEETSQWIIARVQKIYKALAHRPAHADSDAYREFLQKLKEERNRLKEEYPELQLPDIDI